MQRAFESSSGSAASAQRRSSTESSQTSCQSCGVHTQYVVTAAAASATFSGDPRPRPRAIASDVASTTRSHCAA